ncbi:MAG TPA: DUF6502 family protein [Usitatibacter sp.]|nr:DUF6502 family protein [Usitatibacter sp.]
MSPAGDKDARSALHAAVMRLLRPLVRILLHHGVPFATFAEIARWVYVEVAEKDFALPGRKQTDSRVSVLTGLTRKDVARIRKVEKPEDEASALSYNRAARVVSAWVREYPMEGTSSGVAPLPLEGRRSLSELVRRHSGDMPVRAVVDELLRVGAIRLRENGEAELLQRHYLPPQGERRKLVYLGDDVADLIATIGHNLRARPSETLFQRKVFYDNIPAEHLESVRAVARKRGEAAIDALVHDMGMHDRDANAKVDGSGRFRAMVGIYYHEEVFTDQHKPDASGTRSPEEKKPSGREARSAAKRRPNPKGKR